MDQESTIKIMGMLLGSMGVLIGGLLLWGIKALISTLLKVNQEVAILNSKIGPISEETKSISKMKQDINAAHARISKLEDTK